MTDEQRRPIELSREIARGPIAANAAKYDLTAEHPVESFAALQAAGFYGMAVPKRFGGWGLDYVTCAQCMHEFGQADASTAAAFNMHNAVMYLIDRIADEEQKIRWFGEVIETGALMGSWSSEPGTSLNSPRISIGTSMSKRGDTYVIKGQKHFCSLAGTCRYAMIMAVAEDRLGQENADDVALAIVPTSLPGVTVHYGWDTLGMRATTSHSVSFENVEITGRDLLGGPGAWSQYFSAQPFEIGHSAVYAGVARAALDFAIDYSAKRTSQPDNVPYIELPWIQTEIAELSIEVESTFLTVLDGARRIDHDAAEAAAYGASSRAKAAATKAALHVTSKAFDIVGGSGALRRYPLERYFRDARTQSLMTPTYDQILRTLGRKIRDVALEKRRATT